MTANPLAIKNSAELADFLTGRDDDDLAEFVADLGVGDVLRAVFDGLARGYLPEEGPRDRSVVLWEIQDPGRGFHVWQTVASRDGFTAAAVAAEKPDVTLRTGLVPFLRLMARELRGIEALSAGTLKLKGDIQLAMEMQAWFAE